MSGAFDSGSLREAIGHLQYSYVQYMASLKRVLDLGVDGVPMLIAALDNKHASPIAKALGLMMHYREAEEALPRLFDWLVVQSPLYPDVLEALVRAGNSSLPLLAQKIAVYAEKGDDEAVRNLLDLGWRLPSESLPEVVSIASRLFENGSADIREAAVDVIWRIGLPHGRRAQRQLKGVALHDSVESVRIAAREALCRLGETDAELR